MFTGAGCPGSMFLRMLFRLLFASVKEVITRDLATRRTNCDSCLCILRRHLNVSAGVQNVQDIVAGGTHQDVVEEACEASRVAEAHVLMQHVQVGLVPLLSCSCVKGQSCDRGIHSCCCCGLVSM